MYAVIKANNIEPKLTEEPEENAEEQA